MSNPAMSNEDVQGVAAAQLKSIVERIERLEEEKKAIADDIKDVYGEAKGNGYDTKALRADHPSAQAGCLRAGGAGRDPGPLQERARHGLSAAGAAPCSLRNKGVRCCRWSLQPFSSIVIASDNAL